MTRQIYMSNTLAGNQRTMLPNYDKLLRIATIITYINNDINNNYSRILSAIAITLVTAMYETTFLLCK